MSPDDISRVLLTERAVGQFPISVATSLAIESLVGILPEAPAEKPPIQDYDTLWINIRTLIRNMLGALDTDKRKHLTEYTVAEYIVNEMRAIETVCIEHGDGRFDVEFYVCSYTDLAYNFNKSILKVPNTPGQKHAYLFEQAVLEIIDKDFKGHIPYHHLTRTFPEVLARALLLSHYAIDLLQRYRFQDVALLESHTGAIKPAPMWNTKLHNGKELERIPFDKMTIQMFGDNVTFSPMAIKVRKKMVELAEKHKWTPLSTKDFVIHCVEQNRDPALEALVKDLYRI